MGTTISFLSIVVSIFNFRVPELLNHYLMHDNPNFQRAETLAKAPSFIKKNILAKKSLSWRYLFYRIARPLLKGYYKQFKFRHKETPWTSPASIIIFDQLLTKEMTGFEYGSGKSTIFFAKKLKSLVSVEHNKDWYDTVSRLLKKKGISNVQYQYIPSQTSKAEDISRFYEEHNLQEGELRVLSKYYAYFQYIKTFPDNYFDFIIVDGRARVECAFNAFDKLRPGGMFVLDNSERRRYRPVHRVLQSWKKVYTTNGLTDTTIWFKPLARKDIM